MEKRFLLAISLSLLILLAWSAFTSKTYHIDNKEVTQLDSIAKPSSISEDTKVQDLPLAINKIAPEKLLNFHNKNYEILFNENQASIKDVVFKFYQSYKLDLKHAFLLGDEKLDFKKESSQSDRISFVHSDKEKKIVKEFIFSNSNYDVGLEIRIKNLTSVPLHINLPIYLGAMDFSDQEESRFMSITIYSTSGKILHNNSRKDASFDEIKYLGLRNRYFCTIIEPVIHSNSGFVKKINPQISDVGLYGKDILISPYDEIVQKYHIYIGPQEIGLINSINPNWTIIVNYGTFDFISQFLLNLLGLLHRIVHNWGWAIVILSVVIYFLFYPLSLKQMRSMKEMQALQPEIEELRRNYKDNPQKLNKEIMELYRRHKVNPLGGCLPLLLQMPIFFALYQTLMRSIVLRGADFLWIKDLAHPDRLFLLPVSLPVLGKEINILPIIMTISMFIQQKISTASTSGSKINEQQKIMSIIMPVMFGVIFYHMPSGLVLYWFVNSALMLIFQYRINKAK